WTDRVNVQEVKKNSSISYKVWNFQTTCKHNITTTKPKVLQYCYYTTFRSGLGSASTIGIYWLIIKGQIIMLRIKKTNN
ncbi:hypothetical protein, partial [Proteus sp. G4468]|uniref:hypothetical protein n=1 Tax=Proteus sp. G4468 TaxID=2698869 RepID=UPI00193A45AD